MTFDLRSIYKLKWGQIISSIKKIYEPHGRCPQCGTQLKNTTQRFSHHVTEYTSCPKCNWKSEA